MTTRSLADDNLLISPRKVGRDLLILVPLLLLLGYGIKESGWLAPVPVESGEEPAMQAQAPPEAPAGTSPEVLAILAHLDRDNPTVLAHIGEMEITQGDLDARAATFLSRTNQPLGANLKPEVQAEIARVQMLMEFSEELAEEFAAEEMGIVVDDATIDTEIKALEERFGGAAALDEGLSQMGTDREGMKSLTRRNLEVEQLRNRVLADAKVDPASPEAREVYEAWLARKVASLNVAIVNEDFKASIARLNSLFGQALEDGHAHNAAPMTPSHADVKPRTGASDTTS